MTLDIPEYPPLKKPEEKPPKPWKGDKPGSIAPKRSNFRPLSVKARKGPRRKRHDKRFVQYY